MTELPIDLTCTPFSRRGSYLAVSHLVTDEATGIFLRTVHGDARQRELLSFVVGGSDVPKTHATAGRLTLSAAGVSAELALDGSGRAIVGVRGGSVTLEFEVRSPYDVLLEESPGVWRFVATGANRNYRITAPKEAVQLDVGWDGIRNTAARLTITTASAPVIVIIDEFTITPTALTPANLDEVAGEAERAFETWLALHGTPSGEPMLDLATRLAAYVTWSALVPAGRILRRESMLMSKNAMAHIWSWDHCFNAMALSRDPDAAADQMLTLFDHQDAAGGLPDHIDDARVQPNFAKPPIHGWAVSYLMDRNGLSRSTLETLYEPLTRWTGWWFAHRVYGIDGVPSYNHGNDSGWDNSTVFAGGVPLQSPDLLAFLALQQNALARLCVRLGRPEAPDWQARSAATVRLLLAHFWRGDRFVARDTRTGDDIRSESLLTLMPLVLGEHLPKEQFDILVRRLLEGGYLTDYGIATEPVTSRHYVPDGYWRGPIWAPTTMLLIDGLKRGGRDDLADEIIRRFLNTCADAGMAENFDALTGEGLRDRSMTWTASVYLALLADLRVEGARAPSHGRGSRAVSPGSRLATTVARQVPAYLQNITGGSGNGQT